MVASERGKLPFVHAEASELLDVLRLPSTITCGLGTGFRAEKVKIHMSMIILRAFYRQDLALKPAQRLFVGVL